MEADMEEKNQTPHINVDYFEDLTGDIKTSEKSVEEIGKRIKSIRESKGLSLNELSNMTGFDVDFLEGIENEKVQPQLGTVIKLSKALDAAFSRLISGVGSGLYSVTRKDERKIVARSTSGKGKKKLYSYQSLAPEVKGRHMEALMVTLEENPEREISVHDGEEFIYVVDGTAVVKIGEDQFELTPGDSIYYLSTTPHSIAAKSGTSTILAVLYEG
jgi:quercetin dioxygenase-like cupin family protein/DNA-binding XRE family transcriptional regulator